MEYRMNTVEATSTIMVESKAVRYSGFWKRFLALFIDVCILYGTSFVPALILLFFVGDNSRLEPEWAFATAGIIISCLAAWLYCAQMESSHFQATVGKIALGIIVTDESENPTNFSRASGRFFAKILSALILLFGFIMAAFTAKKQALHDIIAGTLVVYK